MTDFIRERRLLETGEIDAIVAGAPLDLIDFQRAAAGVAPDQRPLMRNWLERFTVGLGPAARTEAAGSGAMWLDDGHASSSASSHASNR